MQLPDCEHLCKGSCGKCRNGRLHISCTKECNKILFCGHECQSKCSKVCPPCSRPCETACGHNQCGKLPVPGEQAKPVRSTVNSKKNKKGDGRKCGEPCPPCAEDCLNHCEHRKCENKCGDACSVQPCNEP
uniref:Uncharacterized protein n=1 Tax=Panagrolaimus sp. ES5 TaxID=591445 RepID=A0AC34GMY9_9BILA